MANIEKKESVLIINSPINQKKSINSPSRKDNVETTMKEPPPIEMHKSIIIPPPSVLTTYNNASAANRARKKLLYPGGSSVNLSLIRNSQQSDAALPVHTEKPPKMTQPALFLQDLYL